jgi:hypothetical protein
LKSLENYLLKLSKITSLGYEKNFKIPDEEPKERSIQSAFNPDRLFGVYQPWFTGWITRYFLAFYQ